MKKFMLILVVLTIVFANCASPVDEVEVEEPVVVNPFEGRWIHPDSGYIFEYRGNQIIHPDSRYNTRFEYDDTYYYEYAVGSYIFIPYRYEFKDNGSELHLTFATEKNYYGVRPTTTYYVYLKIED